MLPRSKHVARLSFAFLSLIFSSTACSDSGNGPREPVDFSGELEPADLQVWAGGTWVGSTVVLTRSPGFEEFIQIRVLGAPEGMDVNVSPSTIKLSRSTISVRASTELARKIYHLEVFLYGGPMIGERRLRLDVSVLPPGE